MRENASYQQLWQSLANAAIHVTSSMAENLSLSAELVGTYAKAFSRIRKLLRNEELWETLGMALVSLRNEMNERDTVLCVSAFSNIRWLLLDHRLWRALKTGALLNLKRLDSFGVANCVNGFSKVRLLANDCDLWEPLAKARLRLIPEMNSHDISTCINGFSHCAALYADSDLWDALTNAGVSLMHQMNSKDVADCVLVSLGNVFATDLSGKRGSSGFSKTSSPSIGRGEQQWLVDTVLSLNVRRRCRVGTVCQRCSAYFFLKPGSFSMQNGLAADVAVQGSTCLPFDFCTSAVNSNARCRLEKEHSGQTHHDTYVSATNVCRRSSFFHGASDGQHSNAS